MELGRLFVNKVGTKLEEANLMLKGDNKLKLAEIQSGNTIPEGEPLIMRGLTSPSKLPLRNDIYTVAMGERLMVSLGEFASAADFAISVSPEKGTASGWFIREDQTFYLDLNKAEATVMGKVEKINLDDVKIEDEHILVSSLLIEKWFGLEIGIDLGDLVLHVRSAQPLPVEELDTRRRRTQYASEITESKLPLKEEPPRLASKPYADVSIDTSLRHDPDGPLRKDANWSLIGSGDLLGFTTQTFVSGHLTDDPTQSNELVDSVRQIFTREDPDGKMLGPLHAKRLSFGDITAVQQPFTNGAGSGLGVRVSNRLSDNFTTLSSIDVRGDGQPGWDVELYQNDSLLGIQNVASDGQYNFQSVFLYAGHNNFRLVFYGPQGEVREETRDIYSGASDGIGGWDVALSRADSTTWPINQASSPIKGDPQITARYEKSLGVLGTAQLGFSDFSVTDGVSSDRQTFAQAGLSTTLYDTLLTTNAAVGTDGTWGGDFVARRRFGKHNAGLTLRRTSEDFSPGTIDTEPGRTTVQANLNGPLGDSFLKFSRPNYTLNGTYTTATNGTTQTTANMGVGGRLQNLGLGAGLQYTVTEEELPGGGVQRTDPGDRVLASTTANGSFSKGRWRLTSTYDINPLKPVSYFGSYSYSLAKNLEGVADVTREVDTRLTRANVTMNWFTDKFTLSPRLSVDSERQVAFNTNLRFSLAPNPYGGYEMFRRSVVGGGGVAGRVFLDANGDGIYNQGETLLEDAEIKAAQYNASAFTDKKGTAFIPDVGRGNKVDITLNPVSLPDPYYITMDAGNAVLPRPGIVSKFDFPVVVGGETDGQAEYLQDGNRRIARSATVALVAPDGTVEKSTGVAYDGYWAIESVRPGIYYLTAAPNAGAASGFMMPRLVEFTPQGTTMYGQNVTLLAGYDIPFRFSSVNRPPIGERRARVVQKSDIESQAVSISLGAYRSRLGLALAWYKFRLRTSPWNSYFDIASPLAGITPDPATGTLALPLRSRQPLTMTAAAQVCEELIKLDFQCEVSVVTKYRELVPTAETTEVIGKKDKS